MKKIALLLFIGLVSLSINAQEKTTATTDSNAAVFEFETDVIDYGTIQQNADGLRVFKFKELNLYFSFIIVNISEVILSPSSPIKTLLAFKI